ncbi:MAG: VCBS repeat-containing protein [Pirellulaceae bacterium]|jgi:VCBS repeat-containing protein
MRYLSKKHYFRARKAVARKDLQRRRLSLEQLESRYLLDASGLVGYWQFDNGADLGLDSSSNNNQLGPFGGTAFNATGQTAGAANFDGVDDAIAIDNGGVPNDATVPVGFPIGSSAFSFSTWVQPTGTGNRQIVGWGNSATNSSNTLSIDDADQLQLTTFSTTLQVDTNDVGVNLVDGAWHHVAGVFNGTTRSLWVDGNLVSSDIASPGLVSAGQFRVGNSIAGSAYSGGLDELAVFTTPLNQAEIAALAAGAAADNVTINTGNLPTPIGYWTFDSPANIGEDTSPLKNDLTPIGDSVQSTAGGRFDNGLSLGGSADYLAPGNGAGGEDTNSIPTDLPIGNQSYAISTWIKPTATGSRGMVGWGNYGSGRQVNAFRIFNDNGFRHYWWSADLDAGDASPTNLDDGQWHHALVTYNGTTRQLWLDGTLLIQDIPGTNNSQPRNFRIGNTNNGENFLGMLDDVAIWNVGLSSSEIQGLANGSQRPISPNAPPTATNDTYNAVEDQTLIVNFATGLLANDSDSAGDSISALLESAPDHGTVELGGDGSFQYTPNANYFGTDSFTYRVIDASASAVATVSLNVANVADSLVAVEDTYVANPGATIIATVATSPILNDENPDQINVTFNLVNGAGTAAGTFVATADGFTYSPANANFVGTETAVYTIDGPSGETSNQGTITFLFDNQPLANTDDYSVTEDGSLTIVAASGALDNDTDAESDQLTAALLSAPGNGTLTFNSDGSFQYTPNADFAGVDIFTYHANDGDQYSAPGTVSINVTAVNDGPIAGDDNYVGIQDQTLVINIANGVAANDIDIDSPALMVAVGVTTISGSLSLAADGSFTYQPNVGFTGNDSFTYIASDGNLTSNGTVEIRVLSLDEQIVINEIHYEPFDNSQRAEFVELYHAGILPVNLGDWSFTAGINFTFPANTMLNAGEYLVIAEDPTTLQAAYGITALGPFTGSLANVGERIDLQNDTGDRVDRVEYGVGFPWPLDPSGAGNSMELLNPNLDNNLSGSWRAGNGGIPTPGELNSVFATNSAPQIRQVEHSPKQPVANQAATLTAKVTDPDGVENVTLHYQLVLPGQYIPAWLPVPIPTLMSDAETSRQPNPDFEDPANWIDLVMVDDGTGADAVAGDSIYTAQVPGQDHRTLVRYRITVEDSLGEMLRVPYADDPSLNFAYFTYDGVPDYVATTSVQGGPQTYSSGTLNAAPVYHLITRNE